MIFALFFECEKYEMLWNVESGKQRCKKNCERVKELLEEINNELLTADLV
jgi:hypothetical protein